MKGNNITQMVELLADKLGNTAEKIYAALIGHARAEAVKGTVGIIACIALIAIWAVYTYKVFLKEREDGTLFETAWDNLDSLVKAAIFIITEFCLGLAAIICAIVIATTIPETIDAVLDPKYWAISQILKTLKS